MLIGLVLLGAGCYRGDLDDRGPAKGSLVSFYDLKGFFSKEVKRLDRQQPEGIKTVRFDGKSETIGMNAASVDYGKELASFISSDINKPSWIEKYRIDSVSAGSDMQEIRYTALDEHLKTREIRLVFKGDHLTEVRIRNRLKSIIAESTQTMSYSPGSGYAIEGVQRSRIGSSRAFSVSVAFE